MRKFLQTMRSRRMTFIMCLLAIVAGLATYVHAVATGSSTADAGKLSVTVGLTALAVASTIWLLAHRKFIVFGLSAVMAVLLGLVAADHLLSGAVVYLIALSAFGFAVTIWEDVMIKPINNAPD